MRRHALVMGSVLAVLGTAAGAATPSYVHGILRCPDGSSGPTFVAAVRPTARDLDNACAFRASQRAMRSRPMVQHPKPTMSREELNRESAKLIGTPK